MRGARWLACVLRTDLRVKSMSSSPPLILTLKFDDRTFAVLDELRQQHFPRSRNVVPAHITLFHALPGEQEQPIRQTLHTLCAATPLKTEFCSRMSFSVG